MSFYTVDTFQAEIDYRSDRIRKGAAKQRRHRRTRVPFVRRPAEASDSAR